MLEQFLKVKLGKNGQKRPKNGWNVFGGFIYQGWRTYAATARVCRQQNTTQTVNNSTPPHVCDCVKCETFLHYIRYFVMSILYSFICRLNIISKLPCAYCLGSESLRAGTHCWGPASLIVLPWRGLRQPVLLAVLLPRVLGVSLQLVVLLCPLLLNPLGLGRLQPLLEQ